MYFIVISALEWRLDVLVPSNEAALLFPVGQIQLPGAKDKLTDEQKKSFSQNIQTLFQHIESERTVAWARGKRRRHSLPAIAFGPFHSSVADPTSQSDDKSYRRVKNIFLFCV